jgi:N-acetylglucosaminyldiphosphoundecaprenol N-acetyl-beta-D-mannosaminyltransferase
MPDSMPAFSKYRILGVWLNSLNFDDILQVLRSAIESKLKIVLANQNLHSVYIYTRDAKVRKFFDHASYVHADGMPLIIAGKLSGYPFRSEHRIGYMDLFPALIPHILEHGWRVFYLGATDEVLQGGLKVLRDRHPDLQIAGYHGYFNKHRESPENSAVVDVINKFQPHILFVGMGMPTQEHWILENQHELDTNVILHCGALINYIAGAIPTPPRWLGPLGLEWAFRLLTEPRRMWHRYLIEPMLLLYRLAFKKTDLS